MYSVARGLAVKRLHELGMATDAHPRLFTIPIVLTPSWYVAVAATVTILAFAVYPYVLTSASLAMRVFAAVLTTLLVFGGMLLHELAHALTARHLGVPVEDMTLQAIGGVTHAPRQWRQPRHEFAI